MFWGEVSREGASESSVSRQRVNQALRALQNAGLLRIQYGGVTVLDPAALRSHGA
jgi:CRP/FNR family cyclic AMP-dependent transcriptional regulator